MTKEELEKIKEELKRELLNEVLENTKNKTVWTKYTKDELLPVLNEKFNSPREIYPLRGMFSTLVRITSKKDHVNKITEEDLEKIKPMLNYILNFLKEM